jgi:hypothetical protein
MLYQAASEWEKAERSLHIDICGGLKKKIFSSFSKIEYCRLTSIQKSHIAKIKPTACSRQQQTGKQVEKLA